MLTQLRLPENARRAMVAVGLSVALVLPAVPALGAAPWFVDPLTPSQRAKLVKVPKKPAAVKGKPKMTRALYRTRAGALAVPASRAVGHQLGRGQAVVVSVRPLFARGTSTPTQAGRTQAATTAASLGSVASISCEGYADYQGRKRKQRRLAAGRAASFCALLRGQRPSLSTVATGYGARRPVVVGGTARRRAANDRVVVVVTGVRAASATRTAPTAPLLTLVTGGVNAATLHFYAPSSNGGAPVTGYQWSNDRLTWASMTTSGGSPYSVTLTGLAAGSRTFHVRAVNAIGAGPAGPGVSATVRNPALVPGAPTFTNLVTGIGTAFLEWTAPASDGGSAVTGYEWSDGGDWHTLVPASASPFTATLLSMPSGSRTFTIRAVNAIGAGPASSPRTGTISAPAGVPGVPDLTSVVGGLGQVVLGFTQPTTDGGSAITGYEWSSDLSSWAALPSGGTSPFSKTLTSQPSGLRTYYVRAKNANGAGAASAGLPGTVTTLPAAPSTVSAVVTCLGPALLSSTLYAQDPQALFDVPITGTQYSLDGGGTWATGAGANLLDSLWRATLAGSSVCTSRPTTILARFTSASGTGTSASGPVTYLTP